MACSAHLHYVLFTQYDNLSVNISIPAAFVKYR